MELIQKHTHPLELQHFKTEITNVPQYNGTSGQIEIISLDN